MPVITIWDIECLRDVRPSTETVFWIAVISGAEISNLIVTMLDGIDDEAFMEFAELPAVAGLRLMATAVLPDVTDDEPQPIIFVVNGIRANIRIIAFFIVGLFIAGKLNRYLPALSV